MSAKRSYEAYSAPQSPTQTKGTIAASQIAPGLSLQLPSKAGSRGPYQGGYKASRRDHSQETRPRGGSEPLSSSIQSRLEVLSGRTYAPDASVVLLGIRGAGKSSLAVIAASALGFRVVDADQHFYHTTGQSRAAFKSTYGVQEYRRRELEVMHSILFTNESRCVITCGPGSVEGRGQEILRDYSKSHLLIYVMRDVEDIQQHLRLWDVKTISNLVELSGPRYRALSSFEFYNISERSSSPTGTPGRRSKPSLRLKDVERDFLRLLYNITRQADRHGEHEARHVLSLLPVELKNFTYALSLPLSGLIASGFELRELDSTTDAVEFIVDIPVMANGRRLLDNSMLDQISKHFYLVRRYTRVAIIFHVQVETLVSVTEGQSSERSDIEEVYFQLLYHGLRLGPEYLCVDMNCSGQYIKALISTKGSTKIIGHYFDPHPGLNGWASQQRKEMLCKAEKLGSDIVRLCQPSMSMLDNISVQQFSHEVKQSDPPHRPLIAYNTGELGRMSCCFNQTLTPVTHHLLRSLHPAFSSGSLLTIHEAQTALYASFRLDHMSFSVFGSNIAFSLVPSMHKAAFRYCGIPHEYRLFQCSSLKDIEGVIKDPHFGGASVTLPFKRDIIQFVDYMSPDARAIGAVNTLIPLRSTDSDAILDRNRAGPVVGIYGENTDWIGIHSSISQNLSPANAVKKQTTALVLGAGGMARAAVYALIRLGIRTIFIQNRTRSRAEEVAQQFNNPPAVNNARVDPIAPKVSDSKRRANETDRINCQVKVLSTLEESWPERFDLPTVVVSCIPPQSPGSQPPANITLPEDWLAHNTGGVVVELAYNTIDSPLLKQIRETSHRGWIAVSGLHVLPEQGIPQFELFTGRRAPRELMRNVVIKSQNDSTMAR